MATKAKLAREIRLDKRLTQAEVAKKMKISQLRTRLSNAGRNRAPSTRLLLL